MKPSSLIRGAPPAWAALRSSIKVVDLPATGRKIV